MVSWFTRAKVLARSVPSKSRRAIGKSSNRRSVAPNPCGFHWCVPGSFAGRSSAWGYAGCGEKLASPRSVAFNPAPSPTSTSIPLTRPRQPSSTGAEPSRYSRIALGNTDGGSSRVLSPAMDRTHPMSSHRCSVAHTGSRVEHPAEPVAFSSSTHGQCPITGYMLSRKSATLRMRLGSYPSTPDLGLAIRMASASHVPRRNIPFLPSGAPLTVSRARRVSR